MVGAAGEDPTDYYCCFGGTSAASPYVAGAVAYLQSAAKGKLGRFLTPGEVKTVLVATGDPILDSKAGIVKPRINLEKAVASLSKPGNQVFP
jgi:hypothetical protein